MNDRQKIEYSIIPALLESYLMPLNKQCGSLSGAIDILGREFRRYLGTNARLYRRMDRIANKIIRYTVSQKFDSRKAILAVTEWLKALAEAEYIILEENSDYWNLLDELGEIIQKGYCEIDNFDTRLSPQHKLLTLVSQWHNKKLCLKIIIKFLEDLTGLSIKSETGGAHS